MADDWDEFAEVSTDDALASLTKQGIVITSGFRTEEDVKRLKAEGYTPASSGGHMKGDGVDLVPGKSGMSLEQLAEEARARFGPKAIIAIHNGSHVDVKVPGWGNAPDVYREDPWDAFKVEKAATKRSPKSEPVDIPAITHPAGTPYDGDTFTLNTGDRARLYGVDAFELNQTGRSPSGETIPLGTQARDALAPFANSEGTAHPVGDSTYGRPVVTLDNGGDAGEAVLREGYGLAEPGYLKADPARMQQYMEAERLARLNQLGAHGNTYQKPSDFRHGEDEQKTAVFFDEPTPPEGLRPEIAQGYLAIWDDMKSTPDDLLAYAKANGFSIGVEDTKAAYERRNKLGKATNEISYRGAPRPLIDPGDGRFGTTARGFADPFNAIDELGGVVDTLGGTGGRENLWNSDRRFGDILWNNIDQNRAIIDHDEETHPYYRIGGQLASAAILPGAAVEGGLARVGVTAAEGAAQGFMGGEGSFTERLPDAAVGAAVGAAGGAALHAAIEAAPVVVNAGRKLLGREGEAVEEAAAPTRYAAMDDEMPGEVISRAPDRIDVQGRPAIAPGTAEQRAVAATADPAEMTGDAGSRAANINLDKLYSATVQPGEIRAAMKFTADTFGDFMPARRGIQTWAKTDELATKLGMSVDDMLARKPGEAWNAEMIEGSNRLLDASSAKLIKLKDAALSGGEAEKASFVKGLLLHAAITEEAAGMRAEAGRALGILRKASKAGVNDAQAIEDVLSRLDKGTSVEQIVDMVGQLADDPSALNRFARDAIKPRFRDKLMFTWVMARLSSPATHIVNNVSNTLVALAEGPTYALAAGLGGARRALGGSADRVYASELGPRFYGMLRGAREGLANAKEAFSIIDNSGKVRAEHGGIPFRNDKGITTAGKIISFPGRMLSAEDQLFKAVASRSELNGLAVRKARMEGLKGAELQERIDQLAAHPTDEMMQAATDKALYNTFQNDPGTIANALVKANQQVGWTKLIVPFVRTPANIIKYSVAHSPAAPLLKEVRADFIAGGAKRDLAMARVVFGTGLAATALHLAQQGLTTADGPADESARRALLETGWQPYSFKIGGKYYSYRRLDPFASILGMAANSVELQSVMTEKQQKDAGALVVGSAVSNLASKTWLSGLADFMDAITDPEAHAKDYLTNMAASFATTSITGAAARAIDPVARDTKGDGYFDTIRKKVMAQTPGLSQTLPAKRGLFGDEVKAEGGAAERFLTPAPTRTEKDDPVAKAVYESGARFDLPKREVQGGRLSDEDYAAYQDLSGQKFIDAMKDTLADPEWLTMSRGEQRKVIEKAKNRSRKEARGELFGMEH